MEGIVAKEENLFVLRVLFYREPWAVRSTGVIVWQEQLLVRRQTSKFWRISEGFGWCKSFSVTQERVSTVRKVGDKSINKARWDWQDGCTGHFADMFCRRHFFAKKLTWSLGSTSYASDLDVGKEEAFERGAEGTKWVNNSLFFLDACSCSTRSYLLTRTISVNG